MKLFKQLARIYSPSRQEQKLSKFIVGYVSRHHGGASITTDQVGNIFITRGVAENYPCIVAHLDQVQNRYPKDFATLDTGKTIHGYSPSTRQLCGLGADDKCGIWIALKVLEKTREPIKIAFFVGEEIGCFGSGASDLAFFDDCRYIVQCDRRGASDIITDIYGESLCSEEFLNDTDFSLFGYVPTSGMLTDVYELRSRGVAVSCVNLSCGYYEPHTEREYIVKDDLTNCLEFVLYIIGKCTKVYTHEREFMTLDSYSGGFGDWDNGYYESYSEAYDFAASEYDFNPNLTADDFARCWGEYFPDLTAEDYNEIFNSLKNNENVY